MDNLKPVGVVVSPDNRWVYVANGHGNSLTIIDAATRQIVGTVPTGRRPWGVAVTADGRKVYTANGVSGDVTVIDTAAQTAIEPSTTPHALRINDTIPDLRVETDQGAVDADLVKELAHLLFRVAEGNGWTKDALSFNSLVTSWPEAQFVVRVRARRVFPNCRATYRMRSSPSRTRGSTTTTAWTGAVFSVRHTAT